MLTSRLALIGTRNISAERVYVEREERIKNYIQMR